VKYGKEKVIWQENYLNTNNSSKFQTFNHCQRQMKNFKKKSSSIEQSRNLTRKWGKNADNYNSSTPIWVREEW